MASPDPLATMREQLAAAQADNRALREALGDFAEHGRDCILARYEGGRPTDGGGYEMRYAGKWYETRPVDKTPPCTCGLAAALSRAPGSDEALREMLAWAVSEGARAGEEGARTGRSETNESIVSRILGPEGGKA